MAAPCTEHLFLTGEKGVGKSTLVRHLLAGHTPCGFRTVRVTGVMDRPSVHLLPAVGGEATADNLLFYCGEYDPSRFDPLGTAALSSWGRRSRRPRRSAARCWRRWTAICRF